MKWYALIILLGGVVSCTMADEKENRYCVEYITYEVVKEECVGGRGVAPQMCVPYVEEKLYCVRYDVE